MEIKTFDKKSFEKLQNSGKVCVLQFWSAWCGECFDVDHLKNFQKNNKNVCVFRVNLEDNEELADRYYVKMTPSYLFFKDFELFASLYGIQNENSLRRCL